MTVIGHWQYKLTIPVHIFCVNKDDLRQILFDLRQNGFKLMAQAIMQRGISLISQIKKIWMNVLMAHSQPKLPIVCSKSIQTKVYPCTFALKATTYQTFGK